MPPKIASTMPRAVTRAPHMIPIARARLNQVGRVLNGGSYTVGAPSISKTPALTVGEAKSVRLLVG